MHLSDIQLEEYISGDCGFIQKMTIRRHLESCPGCAQKAEALRLSREQQYQFGDAAMHFIEADTEAGKTLRPPAMPQP